MLLTFFLNSIDCSILNRVLNLLNDLFIPMYLFVWGRKLDLVLIIFSITVYWFCKLVWLLWRSQYFDAGILPLFLFLICRMRNGRIPCCDGAPKVIHFVGGEKNISRILIATIWADWMDCFTLICLFNDSHMQNL